MQSSTCLQTLDLQSASPVVREANIPTAVVPRLLRVIDGRINGIDLQDSGELRRHAGDIGHERGPDDRPVL